MPGIIGLIGNCASPEAASIAAKSITHFDTYVSDRCSPFRNVEIAQVWRHAGENAGSWYTDHTTDVSVFVNGTIVNPGIRPQMLAAEDILNEYLSDRLAPEKYDGSFIIVIADPRAGQLCLCNDRLGTLPCYFFSDANCFCVAPEAKAVFSALGLNPEFSDTGLITFLTLGYCLADTTLFKSIRFLEPASRLVIDVSSLRVAVNRYWRMRYEPAPEFRSRRQAEEALYEAVMAGHRSVFADSEEQFDLLLSGGWDSRGMLAAASKLNRLPRRSMSWGLRDDIPFSNPFLAAQLAKQFGLDHHFIPYDTDTFVENASAWSFLTELNTDNFGWYGEGTSILLNEYAGGVDFVLAGDESWGFGGHAQNQIQGMASCYMPAPFPESIARCLSPRLSAACSDIYLEEIAKVLRTCVNDSPTDRKDFLYIHGRVARFIFSLGYYKELAVEVRRPFLSTQVLDLMQQIPARLRYVKNLYISMLIRWFPEVLTVARRSAHSLPLWRRDLQSAPQLSGYFAGLLSNRTLSQTSFAERLDLREIEKISAGFFATPLKERRNEPNRSSRQGPLALSIKQRLTAYDDVRLALHLRKPTRRPFDDFDLLRRIALLALLDQNLSRFARCREA